MEVSFSGIIVVEFSLLSELLFSVLLSSVGDVSISSGVVSVGGVSVSSGVVSVGGVSVSSGVVFCYSHNPPHQTHKNRGLRRGV